MNNYLLQLLNETKTIIIPGLGALTVTNEATGEIMFMSYLKFDDGTLAKHIADKEGMELNDAKNLIAKFVREVQAEIDKGSTYDMYQFGKFLKEDGEVAFEQWNASTPTASNVETQETQEPINVVPAIEEIVPVVEVVPDVEDVQEAATVQKVEETSLVDNSTVEETPEVEIVAQEEEQKSDEIEVDSNDLNEKEEELNQAPIQEEEIHTTEEVTIEEEVSIVEFTPEAENGSQEEAIVTEINVEEVANVEPSVESETSTNTISSTKEEKEDSAEPIVAVSEPVEEKPTKIEKEATPKMVSPKDVLKQQDAQKKTTTSKKKKRGVFAYVLWGFVVLLLGAGTFVAVNFDSLKHDYPFLAGLTGERIETADSLSTKHIGDDEPAANPDSVPMAEPLPTDESTQQDISANSVEQPVQEPAPAPKPEPKPVPAPKPVVKPTPKPVVKPAPKPVVKPTPISKPSSSKPRANTTAEFPTPNLATPYHLIAGSFGSKQNAKNFAATLKAKGMTNITIGSKDGLYRVSINGYATKEEAAAALPSLKAVAPNAWLFVWQ